MAKPKWLPPLEDFAHVVMGFGARLVYLDFLLWRREAVKQYPPASDKEPVMFLNMLYYVKADFFKTTAINARVGSHLVAYFPQSRVDDMLRDMKMYQIGAYLAEVVRWIGIGVWKLHGS